MSPGVVGITFFGKQLDQTILDPSATNLFVLFETLVLVLGGILGLRRWITGKQLPTKKRKFCGWRLPKHLAELR